MSVLINSHNILIAGGAGYIGSHVAKQLLETTDAKIIILDNLSTGNIETLNTLRAIRDYKFIELDLNMFDRVKMVLEDYKIDTIFHFAASIVVPESIQNPIKYYMNNTVNTTNLIKCAIENKVGKFIFSSTAAVYGEPFCVPESGIDELSDTSPTNPYGSSKLISEKILQDSAESCKNFKYIIFRYFNVAGASEDFSIGERHEPETHIVPLVAKSALGKRDGVKIFGDNYPTMDGTAIRDYIHILDLADIHIKAIEYLDKNPSDIFNVGYGRGYSVKEVIKSMKKVTNSDFKVDIAPKRAGDPAVLVANNKKIKSKMGWIPKYDNLEIICKSAYGWEKKCIGEKFK